MTSPQRKESRRLSSGSSFPSLTRQRSSRKEWLCVRLASLPRIRPKSYARLEKSGMESSWVCVDAGLVVKLVVEENLR